MRKEIKNTATHSHSFTDAQLEILISEYSKIPMDKIQYGWTLYYLVVLFKDLKCREAARKEVMNGEARRIFSQMTYRLTRYPESEAGWKVSPTGIWVVDHPVAKDAEKEISDFNFGLSNDGEHGNAVFAVPPVELTRLKVPFDQEFRDNGRSYGSDRVTKIHFSKVRNPWKTCKYCLKSLKSRRSTPDDVLVFPKSPSEYRHARPWNKQLRPQLY